MKFNFIVSEKLKKNFQDNWELWSFALAKVPLIAFCKPKVITLSQSQVEIKIPLSFQVKNHLGSMYFGALAVGADCAGGLLAMHLFRKKNKNVSFSFKDVHGEFLKRADGDVHFLCNDGIAINDFVQRVLSSKERHNIPVQILAIVPKKYGQDPVAKFTLTLSAKSRS